MVIESSRKFVCARLATYEDKTEAKLLEHIYRGRSGELENTVFSILSHDGSRRLSRAGRSPTMVFGGSVGWEGTVLSLEMDRISEQYNAPQGKKDVSFSTLPIAKDVRRAVNISACDRLPLVITVGLKSKQLQKLVTLAWKEPYLGRFNWASTDEPADLKSIGIEKPEAGIWVVNPDTYGLKATVIAQLETNSKVKTMEEALSRALTTKRPSEKITRRHVNRGNATGKRWESEIPVTDPGLRPPAGRPRRGN